MCVNDDFDDHGNDYDDDYCKSIDDYHNGYWLLFWFFINTNNKKNNEFQWIFIFMGVNKRFLCVLQCRGLWVIRKVLMEWNLVQN